MRVIGYVALFSLLALALSTFQVTTTCHRDASGRVGQQHTNVCFLVFCWNNG